MHFLDRKCYFASVWTEVKCNCYFTSVRTDFIVILVKFGYFPSARMEIKCHNSLFSILRKFKTIYMIFSGSISQMSCSLCQQDLIVQNNSGDTLRWWKALRSSNVSHLWSLARSIWHLYARRMWSHTQCNVWIYTAVWMPSINFRFFYGRPI